MENAHFLLFYDIDLNEVKSAIFPLTSFNKKE